MKKGVNGIRDSRPAPEAVLVGVGKTYSLGQGDHIHLVRALAPVAEEMTGIKKKVLNFTMHTCGAGYPPKLKLLLTGGRSEVPEWDSRMSKLRA